MSPRSVIVADDVAEICNMVAKFLEPFGYRVFSAKSGREALALAQTTPCDVVVTDVLMSDGDGIELITQLKRTTDVRILAISGGGGGLQADYCIQLAKASGAHDTLLKPFDRKQLLAAVTGVLTA